MYQRNSFVTVRTQNSTRIKFSLLSTAPNLDLENTESPSRDLNGVFLDHLRINYVPLPQPRSVALQDGRRSECYILIVPSEQFGFRQLSAFIRVS